MGQNSWRAHRVLLALGDFGNHTYTVIIHKYRTLSIGRGELSAARSTGVAAESRAISCRDRQTPRKGARRFSSRPRRAMPGAMILDV